MLLDKTELTAFHRSEVSAYLSMHHCLGKVGRGLRADPRLLRPLGDLALDGCLGDGESSRLLEIVRRQGF